MNSPGKGGAGVAVAAPCVCMCVSKRADRCAPGCPFGLQVPLLHGKMFLVYTCEQFFLHVSLCIEGFCKLLHPFVQIAQSC